MVRGWVMTGNGYSVWGDAMVKDGVSGDALSHFGIRRKSQGILWDIVSAKA